MASRNVPCLKLPTGLFFLRIVAPQIEDVSEPVGKLFAAPMLLMEPLRISVL